MFKLLPSSICTSAWQAGFSLLDKLPGKRKLDPSAQHLEVGRAGEEAAFFFLRKASYTLIAQGWRSGRAPGDLDIVGWEAETLCFIEVKTRSTRGFATAEAAVDQHKRNTLRRLARYYLRQFPEGTPSRFDLLSVYIKQDAPPSCWDFDLFRNAFGWTE